MIAIWLAIFVISLAVLIKSADVFTSGAEIAGLKLKISPFIIGVTIVSIGTSLPELITGFIAMFRGAPEIVAANAIGSNVANILLVVGLACVAARKLIVKRSLIDLDAPLLAISMAILFVTVLDGKVTFWEAVILVITYIIYIGYTIKTGQSDNDEIDRDHEKIKKMVKKDIMSKEDKAKMATSWLRSILYIIVGVVGIYVGADWTIKSVIEVGTMLGVSASVIAITAIAVGTSLPELAVSVTAARRGQFEIALGNIFGSNIFNGMMVIGVPALIRDLPVDPVTLNVGVVFMVIATTLYIISAISQRVHRWEGLMYLCLYALFMIKIFTYGM